MPEQKEYRRFRELLRKAMGDMSQKAFAERAGLSVEHLNRLLNNAEISRPSKTTLSKIQKASNGTVNIYDLFESCEYSMTDGKYYAEKMERDLPLRERLELGAQRLLAGFKELIKDTEILPDPVGFFRSYKARYGLDVKHFIYSLEDIVENKGTHKGQYIMPCLAEWKIRKEVAVYYEVKTYLVLFFVKLSNGAVMLTDAAVDGETLTEYGIIPQDILDRLYEDGEDAAKLPSLSIVKLNRKKELSAEERLLRAVFGTENDTVLSLKTLDCGHGSVYRETPEGFIHWLQNNKQYFRSNEQEVEILEEIEGRKVLFVKDADEIFAEYSYGDAEGTAGAVYAVLDRKFKDKGYPFEIRYCANDIPIQDGTVKEDAKKCPLTRLLPVLYVSDDSIAIKGRLDTEALKQMETVLKQEFRSLKIPTYGTTLAYTEMRFDQTEIQDLQHPLD